MPFTHNATMPQNHSSTLQQNDSQNSPERFQKAPQIGQVGNSSSRKTRSNNIAEASESGGEAKSDSVTSPQSDKFENIKATWEKSVTVAPAAAVASAPTKQPQHHQHNSQPFIERLCTNWPDIFAPSENSAKRTLETGGGGGGETSTPFSVSPHSPSPIPAVVTDATLMRANNSGASAAPITKNNCDASGWAQTKDASSCGMTTGTATATTTMTDTTTPSHTLVDGTTPVISLSNKNFPVSPASEEGKGKANILLNLNIAATTSTSTAATTSNNDKSESGATTPIKSNAVPLSATLATHLHLHNNGKGSKYWVSRVIGHGASATVLQVKRTIDSKPFAVKVVDLGSMGQSDRFRALAEAECLIHCGNFFSILTCHEDFVVINNNNLNPSSSVATETTVVDGFSRSKSRSSLPSAVVVAAASSTTSAAAVTSNIRDQPHKNDLLALVVDYANAGDLRQEIKKRNRDIQMRATPVLSRQSVSNQPLQAIPRYFKEHEAGLLFVQILLALHHVHRKHMLHRDIKSANIFLTTNGIAKLGDFGFSKLYHDSTVSDNVGRTFCGTPYYVAPEIWRRQVYSKKADVFSLGVVLYELLTLCRPYDGKDTAEVMDRTLNGQYKSLPDHISLEMKALVASLLTDDPSLRPSTRQILDVPLVKFFLDGFLAIVQNPPTQQTPQAARIPSELRDHISVCIASVRNELATGRTVRLQLRSEMLQRTWMDLTGSIIGGSGHGTIDCGSATVAGTMSEFDGGGAGASINSAGFSFGASSIGGTSAFGSPSTMAAAHFSHRSSLTPTASIATFTASTNNNTKNSNNNTNTTATQEVIQGLRLDDARIWWEGTIQKVEPDGKLKARYLCIYLIKYADVSLQVDVDDTLISMVSSPSRPSRASQIPLALHLQPENCILVFAVSKESVIKQCISTPFTELDDAFPVPPNYTARGYENVFSIAFRDGKKRLLMMGQEAADRDGWVQAIRVVLGSEDGETMPTIEMNESHNSDNSRPHCESVATDQTRTHIAKNSGSPRYTDPGSAPRQQ
eukprot:GILJ01015352.1.p1 GENE.GILJ01015352.1~~GILJ01015352.1.p1  ORF type:complete len:1130 (+),score=113.98 GILJ01015352.1:302-3391(+)